MAQPTTARGTVLTYVIGVLALVCIVGAAADFFFVAQNSTYDTEFLAQASTASVQSERIPNAADNALAGNSGAFADLASGLQKMSSALDLMGSGDSQTLMPAASGSVASSLQLLQQQWSNARPAAQTIIHGKDSILVAHQAATSVLSAMPAYVKSWNLLIRRMSAHNLPRSLIARVAGQPLMAEQTASDIKTMLSGQGEVRSAAISLQNNVGSFGDVLNALINGSPKLGINALPNISNLQAALADLQNRYRNLNGNLQTLAPLAADIVKWDSARATLGTAGPQMLSDASALTSAYRDQMAARPFKPVYGYVLGGAALLFIILLVLRYQLTGEARRAARAQQEQNERNQEAIMRLLDELGTLADGDLTVRLEVTEDITGAIADSINYTVEALRELVKTINDTAVQVDAAARQTEATASHLAEASDNQSRQITTATESIAQMA